jgi:hypothetical protein
MIAARCSSAAVLRSSRGRAAVAVANSFSSSGTLAQPLEKTTKRKQQQQQRSFLLRESVARGFSSTSSSAREGRDETKRNNPERAVFEVPEVASIEFQGSADDSNDEEAYEKEETIKEKKNPMSNSNKKVKKEEHGEEFEVDTLTKLKIPELKANLKALGLSQLGGRDELIARLKEGYPIYEPPPQDKTHNRLYGNTVDQVGITYHSDPKGAHEKQYFTMRAVSSQARCNRCLTPIQQGNRKVCYVDYNPKYSTLNGPVKGYHLECFAMYPP